MVKEKVALLDVNQRIIIMFIFITLLLLASMFSQIYVGGRISPPVSSYSAEGVSQQSFPASPSATSVVTSSTRVVNPKYVKFE